MSEGTVHIVAGCDVDLVLACRVRAPQTGAAERGGVERGAAGALRTLPARQPAAHSALPRNYAASERSLSKIFPILEIKTRIFIL